MMCIRDMIESDRYVITMLKASGEEIREIQRWIRGIMGLREHVTDKEILRTKFLKVGRNVTSPT